MKNLWILFFLLVIGCSDSTSNSAQKESSSSIKEVKIHYFIGVIK